MRNLLLPLAVVSLLTVTGLSRGDFDSGGIGPAKPKATQTTGATFGDSVANNRSARKVLFLEIRRLEFLLARGPVEPVAIAMPFAFVVVRTPPTPQPIIKNPSNIPRQKR